MKLTSLVKRLWIFIEILALLLISPAKLSIWSLSQQTWHAASFTAGLSSSQAVQPVTSADLNGDGKPECLVLRSGQLLITDCHGSELWRSPQGWQVKEAQISDLNRDGKPEVTLLVWRPFQPWPIDKFLPSGGRIKNFHDRSGMSCHVILIGWVRGGYNEVWAGSALIRPVSQLHAIDLNGNGWQELVSLEGQYDQEGKGGTLTVWKWNGFGFTLEDQVNQYFHGLEIIGDKNQKFVVVQK